MSDTWFPAWTRSVSIRKLDSYLSSGQLDYRHAKVQELSGLGKKLSLHPERRMNPSFRNLDAGKMKVPDSRLWIAGTTGKGYLASRKVYETTWTNTAATRDREPK